jgi:hypothetical protein
VSRPATRGLAAALVLLVVAAALLLLAAGRTWAGAEVHQDAGVTFVLVHRLRSGRSLSGVGTAAGVIALAGLAALPATRGVGRVAVGGVLVVAGAAAVVSGVQHALAPPAGLAGTGWPEVGDLGGLCLVAAGVLTAGPGRGWPGLSRRHDRGAGAPAGPSAPAPPAGMPPPTGVLWDALDRGEDPTGATPDEPVADEAGPASEARH